jgi:hypothetical protein
MTVPANDRRIQYTATSGQTVFAYDFKITDQTEIEVKQTLASDGSTSTLTLTTEYTVSGVDDAGGGNITLVTGAATGDIITITGNTALTRSTDFNQAGDFLASELNDQLDRQLFIIQENNTTTSRAVLLKDEDTASSVEIPITDDRKSKYLAFDANGDAIASAAQSGVPTSTFMATVLDDETAAAARTTLDAEQIINSQTAITTLQDADQLSVADNSDSDNSKKIIISDFRNEIKDGIESSFKNKIINGDFDIWQRGVSFSVSAGSSDYTSDRWIAASGTGGAVTASRQTHTLGQTDVPDEPAYYYRFDQTTGTSSVSALTQRVESVRSLAGKTITWSFYAKVGSGTLSVTPRVTQYFGSGGSPSSSVDTDGSGLTITTSWQKFTTTVTLPSISGKTLGTNDNDYLAIQLRFPSSTTFTFDISKVQVEEGTVGTKYEAINIQTQLDLCKRYYRKISLPSNYSLGGAGYAVNSTTIAYTISLDVAMRSAPSIVVTNIGNFTTRPGSNVLSGSPSISGSTDLSKIALRFTSSSLTSGDIYDIAGGTSTSIEFKSEL